MIFMAHFSVWRARATYGPSSGSLDTVQMPMVYLSAYLLYKSSYHGRKPGNTQVAASGNWGVKGSQKHI